MGAKLLGNAKADALRAGRATFGIEPSAISYVMKKMLWHTRKGAAFPMNEQFNSEDYDVILESLKQYRSHITHYDKYPSYEFKQQQLARVDSAERKIKALRSQSL